MADFTPIFKTVAKWEAGYQDIVTDTGNYTRSGRLVGTNRGVSAIAYQQYLGYEPTVNDMMAITPKIAENVYRKMFWDKIRGNDIKDQQIAHIIFDIAMNSGSPINRILKNSLTIVGKKDIKVSFPSKFTDETIKAINRSNSKNLFNAIKEERRKHLESLRTEYPEFIKGWLRRLNSFEYTGKRKVVLIGIASNVVAVGGFFIVRNLNKN